MFEIGDLVKIRYHCSYAVQWGIVVSRVFQSRRGPDTVEIYWIGRRRRAEFSLRELFSSKELARVRE